MRTGQFEVLKVGSRAPSSNAEASCVDTNFTVEHYNAIAQGMNQAKVKQTIGCSFNPDKSTAGGDIFQYNWEFSGKFIIVIFDTTSSFVVNAPIFKVRNDF